MDNLLQLSKQGKINASKESLQTLGKELTLFPGLPTAISELKEFVKNNAELRNIELSLEFYIISGGLEELIKSTKLAPHINGIFGCNFAYKDSEQPTSIKSTISFTEKTRYLHGIRKGISVKDLRNNPYKINDAISKDMYRIPFEQMIYIGDGPSDIPCLSAITAGGGTAIGVSAPSGSFQKGYELARGKRITVGPYTANYTNDSDMRKVLEETILRIGLQIDVERKKNIVSAPKVS
jgi:phosphoglycolate phosphatase-like HAD superfamily hydrolase